MVGVVASANLVVERVDGGGHHAHQQLADAHFGNRHILQLKAVGAAKFCQNDCFHFTVLR